MSISIRSKLRAALFTAYIRIMTAHNHFYNEAVTWYNERVLCHCAIVYWLLLQLLFFHTTTELNIFSHAFIHFFSKWNYLMFQATISFQWILPHTWKTCKAFILFFEAKHRNGWHNIPTKWKIRFNSTCKLRGKSVENVLQLPHR